MSSSSLNSSSSLSSFSELSSSSSPLSSSSTSEFVSDALFSSTLKWQCQYTHLNSLWFYGYECKERTFLKFLPSEGSTTVTLQGRISIQYKNDFELFFYKTKILYIPENADPESESSTTIFLNFGCFFFTVSSSLFSISSSESSLLSLPSDDWPKRNFLFRTSHEELIH